MRCRECNFETDLLGDGEPCPRCGGSSWDASAAPPPIEARTTMPPPTVAVTHPARRPWTAQWQAVLDALADLRAVYVDGAESSRRAEQVAKTFFQECSQMREHLKADPRVQVANDLINIEAHVPKVDPTQPRGEWDLWNPLDICRCISNTQKHANPETTTPAGVAEVLQSGGRFRMLVHIPLGDSDPLRRDALSLATECVMRWNGFLKRHGLFDGTSFEN
jgi:hypothetical protein